MSNNFINLNKYNSGSINSFNQLLSQNMNAINTNIENNKNNFDDIFKQTLQGGIQFDNFTGENNNNTSTSTVDGTFNSFKNAIASGLNSVNEKQQASNRAIETFATGGNISVHEVMIASEKSSLSMQMALQMRNKMLAFYNEIKQINV